MKKILLLITFLAMFAGYTNAQIVRSQSEKKIRIEKEKEPKPEKDSWWYARFGLNFISASGDIVDYMLREEDYDCKSKLGYQFVFGFEKPLGVLYWGMEFGLGARGYRFQDIDYPDDQETLLVHNVVFSPFTIGYNYPITSDLSVEAHVGTYVSGDYYGKFKGEEDGVEYANMSIYDVEGYKYPDVGIKFGLGMWFNTVGIDFMWQKGFLNWTSQYDDANVSFTSSNFLIRLGFKL